MTKSIVHISITIVILVLTISSFTSLPLARSTTQYSTLADALNGTINNINLSPADSWTSTWGTILTAQSISAFDNAMIQDITNGNYNEALFVARLASISGYSSAIITFGTQTALQNIAVEGSLPNNYNAKSYGDPNSGCYLVYDRYLLWGYQYAQQFGLTTKFNVNQAFSDFSRMYNKPPSGSRSGEMLFCDPPGNWAYSYSSRYYDEHAETLSVFVKLAQMGIPGALAYADSAWNGLQTHWNGKYYVYTDGSSTIECEMGNFAQVIAEYMQLKGGVSNTPYWNRVLQDLDYKLLVNGWNSPGWSAPGVIVHAAAGVNSEQRLWETMGVMTVLQALYPYFNSTMRNSFDNLLLGSTPAWKGLMSSNLNVGGFFKGASGDSTISNAATICAGAIMFLEGIVPVSGSLNIKIHNEQYQDHRTSFSVSDFQFNYDNNQITIPVNAGTITFNYGTTPVAYNFPSNGNYVIQFSNDWNTIITVNGQPVPTPTPIPTATPTPNPSPSLSPSPSPSPLPSPTPTASPSPSPSPLPSPTPTASPSPSPSPLPSPTPTASPSPSPSSSPSPTPTASPSPSPSSSPSPTPTASPSPSPSSSPSPTPTSKSLSESVKTNKASYSGSSTVTITVTVKDATTGALLRGASVTVKVLNPSSSTVATLNGITGFTGTVLVNYNLGHSPAKGTWTISSTASLKGYQSGISQTSFTIN